MPIAAGINADNQKAPATWRNNSVVHKPPATTAIDVINPMKTNSTGQGSPTQWTRKHARHETPQTTTTVARAKASVAIFADQIRRRSSGWASMSEKVFRPNSRPKEERASKSAPRHSGYSGL